METGTHIVLVDDDLASLTMHRDVLHGAGFEVATAPDGITGLRVCRRRKPQLVLLDLVMPGMDGAEVLHQLRNDERTKAVPVIALTGVPEWLQDHRHAAAEFDRVLLKPVPPDLLIQAVCSYLPCEPL